LRQVKDEACNKDQTALYTYINERKHINREDSSMFITYIEGANR